MRFELMISSSRRKRDTKLRYVPNTINAASIDQISRVSTNKNRNILYDAIFNNGLAIP